MSNLLDSSQRVHERDSVLCLVVRYYFVDRGRSVSALLTSVDKIFSIYHRESRTGGITMMMRMMLLKGSAHLASKKSSTVRNLRKEVL